MKNEQIGGVVRHVLTFGAGYLASKGLIDPSSVEALSAALMTLIGLGWSWYSKRG